MLVKEILPQHPVAQGLIATMLTHQNTPKKVDYAHSLATHLIHGGDEELAKYILALGGSSVYAQMVDNPAYKTIY